MTGSAFDLDSFRAAFSALSHGGAHFDGPGGTQTPDVVADAMRAVLTRPLSNRGHVGTGERNAEQAVHGARYALADLLGADQAGVIFGRSMTALTFDLARTIAKDWQPGDEVVVSRLDHDANVRPWVIAATAVGAVVKWADFDPMTGELTPDVIAGLLSTRTRLVAVTAASNLIGTVPDLGQIESLVHSTSAWLYVDGVHLTPHRFVDVAALGADFYACSPYKFFGPHCGVVAGRPELLDQLRPDKLRPATDQVPERFELGTLPYELMAGTTAAIDFLASIAPGPGTRRDRLRVLMNRIEEHEDRLGAQIEELIKQLPGARIYSRAISRTPTLLVTFDGHDSQDIYEFLGERGVHAPAGNFYAYEASRKLGLGDRGGLRIGLAPYNNQHDVDRLIDGLKAFLVSRS